MTTLAQKARANRISVLRLFKLRCEANVYLLEDARERRRQYEFADVVFTSRRVA